MSTQAHILLVDDESAIIENLSPFLDRSGFVVSTASNGEEAIAKIETESPELVVSDVLMPNWMCARCCAPYEVKITGSP